MRQWWWMDGWIFVARCFWRSHNSLSLLFCRHCKFLSEALMSFLLSSPMIVRSYFTPAYHYHLHHHQLKQQKLSCSLFQSPKSYHLLSNSIRPSFFLSSSFGYNEAVMMFHATASDQTLWVKKKTAVSWRDDSNLQWQPCSFSSFSLSSDSTPLSEPLILLQDPLHSYSPICYASFLQLIIIPFLTFFLISFIYLFLVSSINYFHNCPSSINFFTALTFFLVLFLSQEWEADID